MTPPRRRIAGVVAVAVLVLVALLVVPPSDRGPAGGTGILPGGAGRSARVEGGEPSLAERRGDVVGVATDCAGPFRVVDPVGERVEGARLLAGGHYFTTDAAGEVYWPGRPCGELDVGVRVDDVEYPGQSVAVEGVELVVVELPADHEATIRFVDASAEPVDVTLRRTAYLRSVERREDGRWWVVAPRADATLVGTGEDGVEQGVPVVLSGGEQDVLWPAPRYVLVETDCADPAGCGWMRCSSRDCEALQNGGYSCVCPRSGAVLSAPMTGTVTVPDGATEVYVSVQMGQTTVTAAWTGPLPCIARLRRGESWGVDGCGADGSIVFNGVRGGPWAVEVLAAGRTTRVAVDVPASGVFDLGPVGPGSAASIPPEREAEVVLFEGDVFEGDVFEGDAGDSADVSSSATGDSGEGLPGDTGGGAWWDTAAGSLASG